MMASASLHHHQIQACRYSIFSIQVKPAGRLKNLKFRRKLHALLCRNFLLDRDDQISSEYCLMVRSVENLPILATLRTAIRAQAVSIQENLVYLLLTVDIRFEIEHKQERVMLVHQAVDQGFEQFFSRC